MKKNYQTVEVNGRRMMFNLAMFQELFRYMADQEGKRIQEYERLLANVLFVNEATIHNWRQNRNCPGSIDIIQRLAEYWKLPMERLLTETEPEEAEVARKEKDEDADMETRRKFTDREKDAVLRIYDKFLDYMEAFKETTGFIARMNLPEEEFGLVDEEYTNRKEELMAGLKHAVYREYIDLRDTVYEDLKFLVDSGVDTLIYNELMEKGAIENSVEIITFDKAEGETELTEEEEEYLAKREEEDKRFFLMIYVETMKHFQNIIDPYL